MGNLDAEEAKRMAQVLGGEVGTERVETPAPINKRRVRNETVDVQVGGRSRSARNLIKNRVETIADAPQDAALVKKAKKGLDPADDPSVPIRLTYRERVRMDRYAGQAEFEIKSPVQVFQSVVSVFGDPPDYINPYFITKRLSEYYKRIELLVTSTRYIFPRNNLRRNERLKRASIFAYSVLDTIRYWNIERITSELARLQGHPRNVKTADLSDILRAVYKPLFILEQLDIEKHIKEAYKLAYKIIYLESPEESKKYQETIRASLSSFVLIRKDIQFLLYPLLLKLLSDRWIPYEDFFAERRNRLMAFLNASDADQISSALAIMVTKEDEQTDEDGEEDDTSNADSRSAEEEAESEAIKARKAAVEQEQKAVERGLQILESLFPKAGWDRLDEHPDFYPYFADVFSLKKEYALISPTDPLQLVGILLRILEELFFGIRFVSFGTITGADGSPERVETVLTPVLNNWHNYIEVSLEKEYLPRLSEYCRILSNAADARTATYTKRLLNELHWSKRLYFLPYYKFESIFQPSIQKREISPLYPEIRTLRKYLTVVATGIEQGIKRGGAEKRAACDGINNPWDQYIFQVPNPVSTRLNALLDDKKRNNANLLFYTLAITVVLDHLVNNENSWAYSAERNHVLFRSEDGGATPILGVDKKMNTDAIFRQYIKQR